MVNESQFELHNKQYSNTHLNKQAHNKLKSTVPGL